MASVSVRAKYREDGTLIGYYARWYDPERNPQRVERSLRTRDQGEAHRKAHEQETEERLGLYDPWTGKRASGSDISLVNAINEYLEWCERRQAARSVKIKRSRFNKLLKRMRPGARLADVTPDDVERLLHALKGRKREDGTRPPASAHTRHNYYASMCGLFSWAVEQQHVRENVMDRVRAPAPADAERVFLTPDEVERVKVALIADGETNGHRKNRAFFADVIDFACATGLRVNELCALNWEHVELTEHGGHLSGTIAVENYDAGRRRKSSHRTKTRKRRRVTLFPRAAEVLARLETYRAGEPGEPVFRGVRGGRLDVQVPTRLFTEYVEMAKLTKSPTFHDLRRTFISWCANDLAVALPVVQQLAGHESINTTMGYVHTSGDTVLDAMERSLMLAGLASPAEVRRATSNAAAAVAAWMAGADAYETYLERRSENGRGGRRGEYMGNAPPASSRAGRSGVVAEGAKSALTGQNS